VDCAVDASAAEQRGVGRVDDHVHLLGGDVALDQHDACHGGILRIQAAGRLTAPPPEGAFRSIRMISTENG
jgi:hypothetical protein